jgi:hypothetical protein
MSLLELEEKVFNLMIDLDIFTGDQRRFVYVMIKLPKNDKNMGRVI